MDNLYVTMKIAKAVKAYLVNLAIKDELPTDLNELSIVDLGVVIKKELPSKKEQIIERASHLLADGELSIEEMVKAIADNKDEYQIIDYVEGVNVWEKVEYSFTCKQFLDEIDYTEDFND